MFIVSGADFLPVRERAPISIERRREPSAGFSRQRDYAAIPDAIRNRNQQIFLPIEPAHDQIPDARFDRILAALKIGADTGNSGDVFHGEIDRRYVPSVVSQPNGVTPGSTGEIEGTTRRNIAKSLGQLNCRRAHTRWEWIERGN